MAYYHAHADPFFADTYRVDMAPLYAHFLPHLPPNALILDAGCGSGRDSRAFLAQGHRVVAFDACEALVHRAREYTGLAVRHHDFFSVNETAGYDGIWACASLLHVLEKDMPECLHRLWQALKPGGVFYLSFKHGEGERLQQGRHFTDATPSRLAQWLQALSDVASSETWITEDARPDRHERWLNALLKREKTAVCLAK